MDVRALRLLRGVDHILHAGDIGDARVIEELQGIAPVTAVRGNVDRDPPTSLYPAEETLELEDYRIFLTHEVKPPKRDTDSALEAYRQAGSQSPGPKTGQIVRRPLQALREFLG